MMKALLRKKRLKRIISVVTALAILTTICLATVITPQASGTGAGLAEWALNAYNSHWRYVYGGSSPGSVDCSGLIYSYCGGARVGSAQLNTATQSGNVSAGIPRVHGLGLFQPGHVGVYVGNGMAVDARNEYYGVCYQSTATKSWTKWFKLAAVSYVTNGWEKFNGNYYYYEDGQYLVNTSREIGGETYKFSSSGISNKTPSNMNAVANKSSSGTKSSSSSNSTKKATTATTAAKPATQATRPVSTALRIGSSGDKVTKLQKRLTELGFYHDVVTGYFGEATQAAYKKFQTAAGVTVDGVAGKSDLAILYSDKAPKASTAAQSDEDKQEETQEPTEAPTEKKNDGTYKIGDQGDEVVKIQKQLTALNYYNEDCTGYFGELTQIGVVAFQKANDLETSGEVDKKTYAALFSEQASENPIFTTPATEETTAEPTEPETEAETEAPTEAATETATEAETAPATENPAFEAAEENVEAAQTIVEKTNVLTERAMASVNKAETKKLAAATPEEKNTGFLLWMLILLGVAAVVSAITLTVNHRRKQYVGAHTRGRKKNNSTVRYW